MLAGIQQTLTQISLYLMKKNVASLVLLLILAIISCNDRSNNSNNSDSTKEYLLSLERNWLKAEFALDTSYISALMSDSCLDISEEGVHSKPQSMLGMHTTISERIKDSIFVDSFRLENEIVNQYDNTAVVTFIVHSFKKNKGIPNEKRTRFFDVWVKSKDRWQLVATQATPIAE